MCSLISLCAYFYYNFTYETKQGIIDIAFGVFWIVALVLGLPLLSYKFLKLRFLQLSEP
jgi:hypothetical protein